MSHSFPPVTIDDVDGAGIEVALSSGTGGGRVRLSTIRDLADSRAYLDPDGARAIARALLEAADEADVRTIEAEAREAFRFHAEPPGDSPADYAHVAAWGRFMGSAAYYIESQQRRAFEDGAPRDAIYHATPPAGDGWVTAGEVSNPAALHALASVTR